MQQLSKQKCKARSRWLSAALLAAGATSMLTAMASQLNIYEVTDSVHTTQIKSFTDDALQACALAGYDGEDYALVMLYPAGDHSKPTIRLYDAQGLVRQLTISASTPDGYYYFAPLTTTDGHAYFRYGYAGPNGKTLYDVLDENGNAVLKGLALCYSYYGGNGLNDLPAGAFMARKGFYYGWMTPDGQWLYCRSIFASSTDEHGYDDLI